MKNLYQRILQPNQAKILLLVLFLIITVYASAQTGDSTTVNTQQLPAVEWYHPDYRTPSEETMQGYRNDSRFDYGKSFVLADIITKIKGILQYLLYVLLHRAGSAGGFLKVVLIILGVLLVIGIIVIIVLKMKGVKLKSIFGKKKVDTPDIEFYSEDVNSMDFESLISTAIKNNNYRLAVRFLYLRNLKSLSDKSLIKWNIHKTNHSYQHEIEDSLLRNKFLETSYIFDYVWYGEFPVNENQYTVVEQNMTDFNKMIGNETK